MPDKSIKIVKKQQQSGQNIKSSKRLAKSYSSKIIAKSSKSSVEKKNIFNFYHNLLGFLMKINFMEFNIIFSLSHRAKLQQQLYTNCSVVLETSLKTLEAKHSWRLGTSWWFSCSSQTTSAAAIDPGSFRVVGLHVASSRLTSDDCKSKPLVVVQYSVTDVHQDKLMRRAKRNRSQITVAEVFILFKLINNVLHNV